MTARNFIARKAERLFSLIAVLCAIATLLIVAAIIWMIINAANFPSGSLYLEARSGGLSLRFPLAEAVISPLVALLPSLSLGLFFCLGWGGVAMLLRRWACAVSSGGGFAKELIRCLKRASWLLGAMVIVGAVASLLLGLFLQPAAEALAVEYKLAPSVDWSAAVLALVLAVSAQLAERGAVLEEDVKLTV